MVKEDKNLTGNARFEGFCIDLLKWIAGQVGFQYAIRLVPDHMYGVYDPKTKEWNGIVRELMEKVKWEKLPARTCKITTLFLFSYLLVAGNFVLPLIRLKRRKLGIKCSITVR